MGRLVKLYSAKKDEGLSIRNLDIVDFTMINKSEGYLIIQVL